MTIFGFRIKSRLLRRFFTKTKSCMGLIYASKLVLQVYSVVQNDLEYHKNR